MSLLLSKLLLPATAAECVGAVGTVGYLSAQPKPALDEFNCPAGEAPSHKILLVDVTDRLSGPQASRLIAVAETVARSVPRQGRLSVFLVSPNSPWEPQEILSLCSPGRGDETDVWNETASLFEAEWRQRFVDPLAAAVGGLSDQPASQASPIIESLAALTSRDDFDANTPNRSLTYIGDGLQHSPGAYSHYTAASTADYDGSVLADDANAADFTETSIEFQYLRRPEAAHIQGAEHKAFWTDWFADHGTTDVIVRGG